MLRKNKRVEKHSNNAEFEKFKKEIVLYKISCLFDFKFKKI